MDKNAFQNPDVIKILNHYFDCTKCDAHSKEEISIMHKIFDRVFQPASKMEVPSCVIISPDFTKTIIVSGYKTSKELEPVLVYVGGKYYMKYSYSQFTEIYESRIRQQVMDEINGYATNTLNEARNERQTPSKTEEEINQNAQYQREKENIEMHQK